MTLDRRGIVFVGGTRFSGADAVATMLSGQPGVSPVPLVARFHSDPWGIPALLHGRIGLGDFAERLRAHEIADRVPPERMEDVVAALRAGYHVDPLQSCRDLFWALVDELAADARPGTLVETSPGNLLEAQTLIRLVPRARFVHVVRDGRDVAAAAAESDAVAAGRIVTGLEWWVGELREIERGMRGEEDGAPYAIPEGQLTVVSLDELTVGAGADARGRLLQGLALGEDGQVSDPRLGNLDAAAIGRGRWRSRVRGPSRWLTTRRYERALTDLEAEGNHAAPALRASYDRLG